MPETYCGDNERNEEIRRRAGIEETFAEKVNIRVLRWPRKVKSPTLEVQQEEEGLGSVG